jgi:hypothetical protein
MKMKQSTHAITSLRWTCKGSSSMPCVGRGRGLAVGGGSSSRAVPAPTARAPPSLSLTFLYDPESPLAPTDRKHWSCSLHSAQQERTRAQRRPAASAVERRGAVALWHAPASARTTRLLLSPPAPDPPDTAGLSFWAGPAAAAPPSAAARLSSGCDSAASCCCPLMLLPGVLLWWWAGVRRL